MKNVRIEIRIHNGHVYNDDVLKIKHIFTSTPQEMWTGAAKSIKHTSAEKKQAASPETKDEDNATEEAHAKEGAEEETPRESDPIIDPDEHEHGGKLLKRPSSKDVKKRPATKEQSAQSKGSPTRPEASTEEPPAKRLRRKQSTNQFEAAKAPASTPVKLIQVKRSKSSTSLDKNAENLQHMPHASNKKTAAKTKAAKAKAAPKETSRAAPKPVAKQAPQPTPQQRSDGLASFDLMAET